MSSGREWGTLIGAAVGFFTGGAGYVALGATLGGAAGGLLDGPTKTEGPRIDDLKVSRSEYGQGIPVIYGTERASPNVIWSTDKIEVAKTTSAGKGGGEENTSYRYYVQQRHLLCETPTDGSEVTIVRMFVDGKLQWDASSGISVGAALASEENPYAFIVVYQGHEDQLPDPIEEIYEDGPGSVSAYRGVVCVRVNGLECPGGRVPQISYVLSTGATVGTETTLLFDVPDTRETNQDVYGIVQSSFVNHSIADGIGVAWPRNVTSFYGSDGAIAPILFYPQEPGYDPNTVNPAELIPIVGGDPSFIQLVIANPGDFPDVKSAYRIDATTGERTFIGSFLDAEDTLYGFSWATYEVATETTYLIPDSSSTFPYFVQFRDQISLLIPAPSTGFGPAVALNGYVNIMGPTGQQVTAVDPETGVEIDTFSIPGISAGEGAKAMYADSTGIYALVINSGGAATAGLFVRGPSSYVLISGDVFVGTEDVSFIKTFYTNGRIAIIGPYLDAGVFSYYVFRFNAVTLEDYKVSDIIEDQLERSGETRYDISSIPDTDVVRGYKISAPASARANIDPLLTLINAYIVDEDGVVKVKKQEDIVSVATISYDELGFAEDNGDPGDPMPLEHTQAIDLPRSVSCSYIEPDFDYQTATEIATRQVTESTEDVLINLPIAILSSDQAKTVAERVLYARYLEQNKRTVKLSRKYAFVSPGDGVTIEYPRGTLALWHVVRHVDTGAGIEQTLIPGDAQLMTQIAVGGTGYVSQTVDAISPPTLMVLIDSPIVRDEDNNPGVYVAAEGYAPSWRGYTLYVGDDDTNLTDRGTVTTPAGIGFAESVLGDWSSKTRDGRSSVILNMGDDELNSITEAVLLTSRSNLAWIGADGRWELIQFQTASDLGDGRYLIYGFLRGLFGTERFRSTHEIGDRFILAAEQGLLRPNQGAGSLGQTKSYRPVSLGRSIQSSSSQRFANNGVGLLPYSPWDARKSKAASNDQTITWQRRSRLSTNALRGIVPLGEATESYSVEFYTSSAFTTLAGTLTSTTKSLTITSAQQTAFGLTPGATLYVHIRQVSDVVGAGAPLEAIL